MHLVLNLLSALSFFVIFSFELLLLSDNFSCLFLSSSIVWPHLPFFLWSPCPLLPIYILMEVASCKILHSHFYVWLGNKHIHVEDVKAQCSLVISVAHLNRFFDVIVELVRGPKDRFFYKFGELDRERMKLPKFRSESDWVLCCNFWPASGGSSTIQVSSGVDKEGWLSFLAVGKILIKFGL